MAEGEGQQEPEVTLEQATKLIEERGGKVFLSDHLLQEHVQNSDTFKRMSNNINAANSMGAAYKRSGDLLAKEFGIEVGENDNFEAVLSKAKQKFQSINEQATEKKEDPAIAAKMTEYEEKLKQLESLEQQLSGYRESEFESQKLDYINKALSGKQFQIPDGVDDKFKENHRKIFNQEILAKGEWIRNDEGEVFLKVEGNTYTGDSIKSKLKEIIDNSGYSFKAKNNMQGMPNVDNAAALDESKRLELFKKEANEKNLNPWSKESFEARKKYGLPIPRKALETWPHLGS